MRGLIFILVFWSLFTEHAMAMNEKTIYGYIEKATLTEKNLALSAKFDTGAASASLSAMHITETDINGKTYLTFTVPSKKGDVTFTCEYVGKIKIKLRPTETHATPQLKKSTNRPVVLMHLKLGEKKRVIRVNLANRKRFLYPLLLGREAIVAFDGIVDPSLKFTLKSPALNAP